MNILITGASRGIGLEFTRQLLKSDNRLLVTARAPQEAAELGQLLKVSPNQLEVIQLDIRDPDAPRRLAIEAQKLSSLDLLVNNAGIYPEERAQEDFSEGFLVNAIAPYLITRELFPLLRKSKKPKAIFLTSLMGSIEDNSSGGSVAYRASKTALNMMVRCLSIDEPWLTSALLHPGWVQTEMGGPEALISTEVSVRGMLRVIDQIDSKQSGVFIDYEGDRIPW